MSRYICDQGLRGLNSQHTLTSVADIPRQPERDYKPPSGSQYIVGVYWARQDGSKAGVGLCDSPRHA